jgi:hypothetical protein
VRLSFTKPAVREVLKAIQNRQYDILDKIWTFPLSEYGTVAGVLLDNNYDQIIISKDQPFPELKHTAKFIKL